MLIIYDMKDKLFGGINSMYSDNLVCVRVKGGDSECFRINSGARQGWIMLPWLFNVYMDALMKIGMGRRGESDYLASLW